jgi:RimJ/RimL family protein N-acetyltransferase
MSVAIKRENLTGYLKVSETIHLTEIRSSDIESLLQNLNSIELHKSSPLRTPPPYTWGQIERFVESCREKEFAYGTILSWAVRNAKGEMIGCIERKMSTGKAGHRDEITFWLNRAYWRQDVTTLTVRVFTKHLFSTTNLVRIEGIIFHRNLAAARVLEKSGFFREGYLKSYFVHNDEVVDGIIFSKLA